MSIRWGLMVERTVGKGKQFGKERTYQQLLETWKDDTPIPTQAALEAEWVKYRTEQQAAAVALAAKKARVESALTRLKALDKADIKARIQAGTLTTAQVLDRLLDLVEDIAEVVVE